MKRLFSLLAFALCALSISAADIYRAKLVFTSNPVNNNTLTINGTVITFRSTVVAGTVLIGATAGDTAENLVVFLDSNPIANVNASRNGTQVDFLANAGTTITGSISAGSYGTLTITSQTIDQFPLNLPLSQEDATLRVTIANHLVDAFGFASTAFSANHAAFNNFVDTAENQNVDGIKTFRGANVYSNANQTITLGLISNVTVRALNISRQNGTMTNGLYFYDNSGNIVAAIAANANGRPSLFIAESFSYPLTDPLAFTPAAEEILNAAIGDFRYMQKGAANTISGNNTFSGANTFNGNVTLGTVLGQINLSGVTGIVLTNATGGFTNVFATNIYAFGAVNISNTAPKVVIHDTDAAADEKTTKVLSLGGDFSIATESDSGASSQVIFQVNRTGWQVDSIILGDNVTVEDTLTADRVYSIGQVNAATFLGAGDDEMLPPTGLSAGVILTNAATEASADPVNAIAEWASGGEWKYRQVGSGVNLRVHNAGAEVVGAGSDYPITGSYSQVTFGGGGNTITLPSAGTYRIAVPIAWDSGGTANDTYLFKLYNASTAADIANSEVQVSNAPASVRNRVVIESIVTVSGGHTIHLYARNATAARGNVISTQTKMNYVRLF